VIAPYLIISLPAVIHEVFSAHAEITHTELRGVPSIVQMAWFYLYGGEQPNYAMWFIPIISIYYFLSPLFAALIESEWLALTVVFLIPLSLLAHRPNYSAYHNAQLALYFVSVYLFGILCCDRRAQFEALIDKYFIPIAIIFVVVFFTHWRLTHYAGGYQVEHIFSFEKSVIDWILLQKLLLIIALIGAMRRLDCRQMPSLDYIGEISFTIYFMHLYVLLMLHHLTRWQHFGGNFSAWFLVFTLTLMGSCIFAVIAHRVFGRWSRVLVGS
jgi:peptidoglycan/LPS O-acetylase OafA/YrhL